jgi:hypothetical protein
LATLNTEELWKEAVAYSAQVMGFDKRVWVKQALNWNGSGGIVTSATDYIFDLIITAKSNYDSLKDLWRKLLNFWCLNQLDSPSILP